MPARLPAGSLAGSATPATVVSTASTASAIPVFFPDISSSHSWGCPRHTEHHREDDGQGFNLEGEFNHGMNQKYRHREQIATHMNEPAFTVIITMEKDLAS